VARIAYPDAQTLSPETRDRLANTGSLNVARMMAHRESLMTAWSRMGVEILRRGALDPILREAVILRVGQLCQSDYEWRQHESVARAIGMDDAMLAAIAAQDFAALPDPIRMAITLAEEIDRDGAVSAQSLAAAQSLFDPAQLVELVMVIGYYRMTAGFLRSFDIETEETLLGASMVRR
jgi:alkylhydroperoxidase family enzyme